MLGLTEAFTLLGGIAVAIGLPSLSLMVDRNGSGIMLAAVSILLGVACFLLVFGRERRPSRAVSLSGQSAEAPRSVLRTLLDLRLWLAGLHAGLFFVIISAFGGLWAAPFFRARLNLEPEYSSYPVAMLFAAGVLGAPLLGLISGRPRWRGPTLIVASFLCTAASAALIYAPGGLAVLLLLIALLGFFSGVFGVDMACVQDAAPPGRRGLAMGAANMILGVVGGPLMVLVIARALDGSSGSGEVEPMHATLSQMREALGWFVGAIALTIPIGVALVLVLKSGARLREPMS
jgi:MFS family permease